MPAPKAYKVTADRTLEKTNPLAYCDTRTVPSHNRFSHWNNFFSKHITQVIMACASPATFSGNLALYRFGSATLAFCRADPHSETNFRDQPNSSTDGARTDARWRLVYNRLGGRISQGRDVCEFRPNDVILIDMHKRYQREANAVHFTAIVIPDQGLHGVIDQQELEFAALRRISTATGEWSRIFSMYLQTLTPEFAFQLAFCEVDASLFYDHFLHLLVGALREIRGYPLRHPGGQASSCKLSRRRLFHRIEQWLQQNYDRSNMTAQSVASEFGISTRCIHRLFAEHLSEVSFHSYLHAHRLDQAVRLLNDPGRRSQPIADISAQCGFSSPSYFCLVFRNRFGYSPSAFRNKQPPDAIHRPQREC